MVATSADEVLDALVESDAADADVRQRLQRGQRIGRPATPAAACPGRRSGCAMVSASVVSSSGVTPRSKAMRSMPSDLQPPDHLAVVSPRRFGSGVSPTMISWSMMPMAIDG